MFIFLI
jgi:hypothetical protein